MAKKPTSSEKSSEPSGKTPQAPARKISINGQYVKDLSFENPHAPGSLLNKHGTPKIDISVDIKVQSLNNDDAFEVNLILTANAKAEKHALFLVELNYAGIFTVDAPAQEREAILMVYCPNMLFPFARRVLADATRDGGFPPLMIDPIDFASLYQVHRQRLAQQQATQVKEKK